MKFKVYFNCRTQVILFRPIEKLKDNFLPYLGCCKNCCYIHHSLLPHTGYDDNRSKDTDLYNTKIPDSYYIDHSKKKHHSILPVIIYKI